MFKGRKTIIFVIRKHGKIPEWKISQFEEWGKPTGQIIVRVNELSNSCMCRSLP
jgi:hypothetical protein